MTVRVGTSGWAYADWRNRYFAGVPQAKYYEKVLSDFSTVELNVSFYRLPAATVFAGWQRRAPAGAVVAVKASRYLTHIRRLRDPAEPVQRLMDRARLLGPVLGPVLVQLPPDYTVDLAALEATLACFPPGVRVAVEPRHDSWWIDGLRDLLRSRDAALVWADRKGPLTPLWRTASWCYVRFHEGRAAPWPRYGGRALASWADRIAEHAAEVETFAYFNNDPGGAAIDDAFALRRLLAARGVEIIPPHQRGDGASTGAGTARERAR